MLLRLTLSAVVLFALLAGPLSADVPEAKPAAEAKATAPSGRPITAILSVEKPEGGNRALVIKYPWQAHERASIEVRLVTGKPAEPGTVRPLAFVATYMKGEASVKVYEARDKAMETTNTHTFTKDKIEFGIVGQRNALGRPSVMVLPKIKNDPVSGPAAIFCFLESWAMDKQVLYLDLPQPLFAKPGELHVWMLRKEKIVWAEKIAWPGK